MLGQGGFGITYVGWDLNLDIKVAIKEYYPEGCVTRDTHTHVTVLTYAGAKEAFFQKGKERFVEEARALEDPNALIEMVGLCVESDEEDDDYYVWPRRDSFCSQLLRADTRDRDKVGRFPNC